MNDDDTGKNGGKQPFLLRDNFPPRFIKPNGDKFYRICTHEVAL